MWDPGAMLSSLSPVPLLSVDVSRPAPLAGTSTVRRSKRDQVYKHELRKLSGVEGEISHARLMQKKKLSSLTSLGKGSCSSLVRNLQPERAYWSVYNKKQAGAVTHDCHGSFCLEEAVKACDKARGWSNR